MARNFKLCHLNIRSLLAHFDDFRTLVDDFDVVGVSETWLGDGVDAEAITIDGFTFYRQDRQTRGGGVGIYVSNKIKSISLISSSINNHCEQIWIRIKIKNTSFAVGCVYRPPKGSLPSFIESLDDSLSLIFPTVDELICFGDVNIDLLSNGILVNSLEAYGLEQLINEPTRICGRSMTLLDPIFITNPEYVLSSGVMDASNVSDHNLVHCELSFRSSVTEPKIHYYRDFKNFDVTLFQQDLVQESFNDIFAINNIDEKVDFFSGLIRSVFERHAPLKASRVTKKHAPWLTFPVKMMMKERDSALAKFKISKTPDDWDCYKKIRNFTLSSIRREKKAYYDGIFRARDSRLLWNSLRRISPQKSNVRLPTNLERPELANDYFSSVFVDKPVDDNLLNFYATEKFPNLTSPETSFKFRFITVDEVGKIISSIKSNAVGLDGITINMLKYCGSSLDKYITHIVNCCIEKNYFPQSWKVAVIRPLSKINDPKQFSDLRPISILPAMSKILERAIHRQITSYVTDNNIIPNCQAGYRAGHSTSSALVKVADDIARNFDDGNVTALITLDFSKAFDTINHTLLCHKLKYYGFSEDALSFIFSYLNNRSQKVQINNILSSSRYVISGVPQGSVLGPLLFIIYSSDILTSIKYCKCQAFADDTQIYCDLNAGNFFQAQDGVNSDLETVNRLAGKHNLKLNESKCQVILFGNRSLRENLSQRLQVKIDRSVLPIVDTIKNLGITFDSDLKFTFHVNTLLKKSFCILKMIYSHRHCLNSSIRRILGESLVLSLFNYGDVVYGNYLTKFEQHRIQKVQNFCCRFVFSLRKFDHVSHKIRELGWLPMHIRRKYNFCYFLYKIMKYKIPVELYSRLVPRSAVHSVAVRGRNHLSIPRHSSAMFQKSFTYQAAKMFNTFLIDYLHISEFRMKRVLRARLLELSG